MAATILIADDEPDLLATWERLLRPRGHRCLTVKTGFDAIALIDTDDPDLVVTDLRLPGADGLAVARHARSCAPPIPVVLVSADNSEKVRTDASGIGVSAVLIKPLANTLFLDTVQRVLAGGTLDPGTVSDAGSSLDARERATQRG